MKFKQTHIIIILLLILISFAGSLYYYDSLPEQIPTHWNAQGEINGYSSKNFGAFFLPLLEIILAIIFVIIPLIEPNKKNVKKFIKQYNLFAIVMVGFFAYLHWLMLLTAQGYNINFIQFFVPAFGILFYFIGIMTKNAKQNYLIGIRTPWTLASEEVWDKTHELGGNLFELCGIIAFFGILFPSIGFWLIIIPVLASAMISVVYSYYIYTKIKVKK
jgi:uncharacterized membrane protein